MSDMTTNASSQIETMSNRAATSAAQQGVRTSVLLTKTSMRVSAHVAHQTVGGTVRALVSIIEAARLVGANKREQGQVGLKQFTRISDGKREILPVEERAVAREFARELRRHGVTFAIERHKDGSRTFHVEGKNAAVVEHALAQASSKVDERIRLAGRQDEGTEQEANEQKPERADDVDAAVVELNDQETEQVATVLSEEDRGLADQVRQQHRITVTSANLSALDTAATSVPAFNELPVQIQDWLIAARADEPSDLSLAEQHHVDLPDITEDAQITLVLDHQEQTALLRALHNSTEPEVITLNDEQAETLSGAIRTHADSLASEYGSVDDNLARPVAGNRYDELNTLAGQIEQSGTVTLDRHSASALQDVFNSQKTPETLTEIEAKSRTFADTSERESLAAQIKTEGQVCLDPETVESLHTMFGETVWTHRDNDHMSWVVGMVGREHDRLAAVVSPTDERMVDNPYLSLQLEPAQEATVTITDSNPFEPDEWEREAPSQGQGATPAKQAPNGKPTIPDDTAQVTARESGGKGATGERDRQLSPRDATRERVAQKIDTKSEAIKQERGVGEAKTRAVPRSPKVKR